MARTVCTASFLVLFTLATSPLRPAAPASFIRGDVDGSGDLTISDPIVALGFLFQGSPAALSCPDAVDADDSGAVDISDPIRILQFLFGGGPAPADPFAACGPDPTVDGLGCQSFEPCAGIGDLVRSDEPRNLEPLVEAGDLEALVAGNAAFALDLYGRVRTSPGNVVFSPHSISIALAMTHAGARGETAAEMAATLRFTIPGERLHEAFNALDLELARRGTGAAGHEGSGFALRIVNSIWGQGGYAFQAGFLDILARSYDAGLRVLDFRGDPERSRLTINDWVEAQTEDRIRDLLPAGSVLPTTRLVLANAVYFSAAWAFPFPEASTREADFTLLDGGTVKVPTMSVRADMRLHEGDACSAVEIPYDGRELSMLVILPAAGRFEEVEASLSPGLLAEVEAGLEVADVGLELPRFGAETTVPLSDILPAMGMPSAFQPGVADLGGMDGTRDLFISDVLHKAFIAVDESGTEAAAATAVVVGVVSVPRPFAATRPFLYLIRDDATGAILFLGRTIDPR